MDSLNIHPLLFTSEIPAFAATGGPCSGKTTILAQASQKLQNRGVFPFILPELATLYIGNGIIPGKTLTSDSFQAGILLGQVEMEYRFHELAAVMHGPRKVIIITDRGRMDGAAYIPRREFFQLARRYGYAPTDLSEKAYRGVIHLRSVAYDAPHLYTTENNPARRETVAEAAGLDGWTLDAWTGHPHLRIIPNVDGGKSVSLNEKSDRFVAEILESLGMPVPVESEHKFRLTRTPAIPINHEMIEIIQWYIADPSRKVKTAKGKGSASPAEEERIRCRTWRGKSVYYHAVKKPFGSKGKKHEVERIISADRFLELLRFVKPGTRPVTKNRYVFVWENLYFELDVFTGFYEGLVILEIEMTNLNKRITFPKFIAACSPRKVTGNRRYSNAYLATATRNIWRK